VCSFVSDVSGELIETFLEVKLSKKNSQRIKMAKEMVLDFLNLEERTPKLYETAIPNNSMSRNNPE
jgi:hypothetical protein